MQLQLQPPDVIPSTAVWFNYSRLIQLQLQRLGQLCQLQVAVTVPWDASLCPDHLVVAVRGASGPLQSQSHHSEQFSSGTASLQQLAAAAFYNTRPRRYLVRATDTWFCYIRQQVAVTVSWDASFCTDHFVVATRGASGPLQLSPSLIQSIEHFTSISL